MPCARASEHPRPFVCTTRTTQSLHFTIDEVQSRMQLRQPDALTLPYTRTMMGVLLFCAAPARIMMIGLGGGSLAKFCYRHLPAARIDVVEINPHVVELRAAFQVPADDARLQVTVGDGARFVARVRQQTDVLLVDGYDPAGVAAALCSDRFYRDAHAALRPGGVMAVNLPGGDPATARMAARIQQVFGGPVRMVEDDGGYNTVVFAGRDNPLRIAAPAGARRPAGLATAPWQQLAAAFARIAAGAPLQYQAAAP
jgi:spermidine synthase